MKIILINNLYAPWVRGGSDKVVERINDGLEKVGHDVFVITTAPKESRTEKIFYLESIFYNLEKYPLWQRFFWHLADIFGRRHYRTIKNILLERKPDLVITNNLMGVGFFVPGLLRKLKIKHIHILHDIQLLHPSGLMFWKKEGIIESLPAKIYQAINKIIFGSPYAIVSPSKWLLDLHVNRKFFQESKKKVLPNYLNDAKTEEKNCQLPIANCQFLYVGQLEEHKGVKLLAETFLEFLRDNSGAELIFVGGGSQLEEIKKMGAGHPEMKVLGRKNSAEVEEFMRKSGCLIVPSLCYENSPTVIYEAIASGLPVIGAKIGGITELLEAVGGLLFEPENKNDLLAKMKLIFTDRGESDRMKNKEAGYQSPDYIAELLAL